MAKFRFKLEPLLRVRSIREEQCQRVLAGHELERRTVEDDLRSKQDNLAQGKKEIRIAITGKVDLVTMRRQALASMQVMRHANRLVFELAGIHKQIERARAALVECTRERRAIELLKERRYAEWRDDRNKAEVHAIDELANSSAYRRQVS